MPRGARGLRAAEISAGVLALLALAACGPRSLSLYEKVMGSPTYERTTERYTRTKEVHDGLETRFILSATWLGPEWMRSFEEEYANIYYVDAARRDRVIAQWRSEAQGRERFFVALFIPDEKGNDLEKPETLWSLRLVGPDEKDIAPIYVRKSSLRPEEIARFFPYSGTWYRAYEVAFPALPAGARPVTSGAPRVKLVLAGVQGRAVLAWE